MGTYIGMGMVGEYIIPKKELSERLQMEFIPTKTDEEIKKEIRKILPEELYKLEEDEKCYDFTLNDDVTPNDVIAIYDEFNKISKRDSSELEYINEHRKNLMQMKTINEVIEYATTGSLYFWSYSIPAYLHSQQHRLFGKIVYVPMFVDIIAFFLGNGKTISEFPMESFDIFTDLLRYRMKGLKLADSMYVFLTR